MFISVYIYLYIIIYAYIYAFVAVLVWWPTVLFSFSFIRAKAQWYSQHPTVIEVAGSISAPAILELLWLKISHI